MDLRKDGVKLKNADPMYTVAAYIMDKRYDAMNSITLNIPVEPMKEYINEKRKEGVAISHMALILAAYVRTIAEYPSLNHFVVNKRIYARNEIAVGMVVLVGGKMDHGTMAKMYFEPTDDVFTVQKKIDDFVEENRKVPEKNGTEKMIKILLSVPGLVNFGVGVFKKLDKHGLLPKKVIDMSPFHTSFLISNLASIRTNHIYHHCYEFGTTSVAITMGNQREVAKRKGGEIVFEKCIPLGVVMDERICSGSYFALAFRKFRRYLEDPTLLEGPPKVVNTELTKNKRGKYVLKKQKPEEIHPETTDENEEITL